MVSLLRATCPNLPTLLLNISCYTRSALQRSQVDLFVCLLMVWANCSSWSLISTLFGCDSPKASTWEVRPSPSSCLVAPWVSLRPSRLGGRGCRSGRGSQAVCSICDNRLQCLRAPGQGETGGAKTSFITVREQDAGWAQSERCMSLMWLEVHAVSSKASILWPKDLLNIGILLQESVSGRNTGAKGGAWGWMQRHS